MALTHGFRLSPNFKCVPFFVVGRNERKGQKKEGDSSRPTPIDRFTFDGEMRSMR